MSGSTGHNVPNCPDTKYGRPETENTTENIRRETRHCPHLSAYRGQYSICPDRQVTLSTASGYRERKQRMSEYREKTARMFSDTKPALPAYIRIHSIVRICPNTEHCPSLIKTESKLVEAAVLTAINTKTSVCWAVPPCSLVITYRRFGYNFTLQLHNRMKNHPDRVCSTHYFRTLSTVVPPKRRKAYLCTRLRGGTPHKIEVFSTEILSCRREHILLHRTTAFITWCATSSVFRLRAHVLRAFSSLAQTTEMF
jgi:hypothetical protein